METAFQNVQDSDRIWVYQAKRILSTEEITALTDSGKMFVTNWAAHGQPLRAEIIVINCLFVVVIIDERQAMATGCSIDKSIGWISAMGLKLGIDFMDRTQVAWYDDNEQLQISSLDEFETLANQGLISSDTMVYNNLVFSGKELKSNWLLPAKESWHSRYFSENIRS
jgi:hypothetical protein